MAISRVSARARSEEKNMTDTVRQATADMLTSEFTGVLALGGATGEPYAALVAFLVSPTLGEIFFATLRTTRKYERILVQPEVALLVDSRRKHPDDLATAAALTVLGTVDEPDDPDRAGLVECFVARFPALRDFVADPACALLRIKVRRYILVRRFQEVCEWVPGENS
jgi:heme iron utilization protein